MLQYRMICKLCGKTFDRLVTIDGKHRNLQQRKYCLECSPFKNHNTKNLHTKVTEGPAKCKTCGRTFTYSRRAGHAKTKCNSCRTKERYHRVKKKAVAYKGGVCEICGYSRCQEAMDFHHINPNKKKLGISHNHNRSWETLQKELDKCMLLCCRCHRELHSGTVK